MIFKYFKNKKEKELNFCNMFCENLKIIIKTKGISHSNWLLSIDINKHNFKILKKHGCIIKFHSIFDEYINFRLNYLDHNFPVYISNKLKNDKIITHFNFGHHMEYKLLTETELLIKSIIE